MDDTPQNERANDPLSPEAHEVPQTETSGQMGEERTSDVAPYQKYLLFAVLALLSLTVIVVVVGVMFSSGGNVDDTSVATDPATREEQVNGELTEEAELMLQEQTGEIVDAGDLTRCSQIENDFYQKVCRNNIAINEAQTTGDLTSCDVVDGSLVSKESCERRALFSLLEREGDPKICAVSTIDGLREECTNTYYRQQALAESDPSYCAELVGQEAKAMCSDRVAFNQVIAGDPLNANCDLFEKDGLRNDCMSLKSLLDENNGLVDIGMCESFETEVFKVSCNNNVRTDRDVIQ